MLSRNDLLAADKALDRQTLLRIELPARARFSFDDRWPVRAP